MTSSPSFGRLVTDIDLRLGRRSGDVESVRVNNKIVRQTVRPALDLRALVERVAERLDRERLAVRDVGRRIGRRVSLRLAPIHAARAAVVHAGSRHGADPERLGRLHVHLGRRRPAGDYRVTVNSFLAGGGDGFSVLHEGTSRAGGALDPDAFEAHFAGTSQAAPLPPPATDRITRVN